MTAGSEATPSSATVPSVVDQRIQQLINFEPDPSLVGDQCGELSISDGSAQIDATASTLPHSSTDGRSVTIAAADLRVVVRFGSGFPSRNCTDVISEIHRAHVDEEWPATAASGTLRIDLSERCSVATLRLSGVVASAPFGQTVDLGQLTIVNDAWQFWPGFDCRISASPG